MRVETFEAQGAADDVPSLRHAVTRALCDAGAAAWADEVELAATELLTNALLHGLPPVSVSVDAGPDGAVLVVRDAAPQLPARLPRDVLADDATTGRGLSLVEALSDEWGVTPRADGKLVWARWGGRPLPPEVVERQPAVAAPPSSEARLRVDIGEAPTALLLAARAHLDGLLRELALAASGSASGVAVHLPEEVADTLTDLVEDFAEARQQIQLQALAAQGA
ncbi:MAG: ATP-binding protein, partial [Actinomycetes bacterium]